MMDPLTAISDWIKCPSVSTDPAYRDGMRQAREFVCNLLREMQCEVEVIDTPLHPIVLAERPAPADSPHVVIYGHYDVQPADPFNLWETPPFEPAVRNGRIYGRGAADNKGPFMVHLAAAARFFAAHPNAPLRVTFLVEGEEEIGSPSFPGFLDAYHDRLSCADFVLLSDTLSPTTEQIALTTGLRGIVTLEIEIQGPKSDLHSGIHGGAVYNPAQAIAEVCATLHTADGRVNIPGFYDAVAPATDWEKEQISRLGIDRDSYARQLGVPRLPAIHGMEPYENTRLMPTLEINGMGGGYQGQGDKTIIPSKAFAKISCRLVANQEPARIQRLVIDTIRERIPDYFKVNIRTGHQAWPYRVVPPHFETNHGLKPRLAEAFAFADSAIQQTFGAPPLYLREGGSVPIIADLKSKLGLDSLMMGMFTPEDNLHAPNESMDLEMFRKGSAVSEAILKRLAESHHA